jgi:hypothetical protein
MDSPPSNLLRLIRLCAVRKDSNSDAWSELVREINDLVRRGFYARGSGRDLAEFEQQFPGWLFRRDKLSHIERALRKKLDSGEISGPEQEESFAKNYLARVIKSAVAEFYHESPRHDDTHSADVFRAESIDPASDERMELIAEELLKLGLALRVPFRLRHYAALGPMPDDELQFIEQRSSLPRAKAAELIESEFRRNQTREFPLSSAFIGELIGIADDDPKSNCVNRRIMRARLRLIESLRGER